MGLLTSSKKLKDQINIIQYFVKIWYIDNLFIIVIDLSFNHLFPNL